MKRIAIILFASLLCLSASAQRHGGPRLDHREQGGRGRHHIECAMSEQLSMAVQVLKDLNFDDKRLEVAKLCVTLGHFCTDDLARLAKVFSFDDNRTKFLIYAHQYCEDPQNYYYLRDVFEFNSNFETMMDAVMPGAKRR